MRSADVLACLLLSFLPLAAAADADGPYVMRNAAGKLEAWSTEATAEGARKKIVPAAVGEKLAIPAAGSLPSFEVRLRPPAAIAPDAVSVGAKEPLFVVADTHGEFEILAGMLMKQGVVDDRLRWSFGRGRLLILGDVFDRGDNQTEILWLLYELEAQSRQAGGAVYLVLGNHEAMVLRGDLRYLHAKYRASAELLEVASYSQLFDGGSVLGQWLRSKPAVLRLNEYLCLHGGISPALVDRKYPLADINAAIRAVLVGREPAAGAETERAEFLFGESGPLWYRGYFPEEPVGDRATPADIDRIRKHFGVDTVLVGHTRVPTITPLYDGRVYAVQVYPRQDSFGNDIFEALLIRDGKMFRALPDGRAEELKP
jgi:diadenosine tetraphosphatase ApaH/serine/threonine PP2A family protein phosphatase